MLKIVPEVGAKPKCMVSARGLAELDKASIVKNNTKTQI
jgi:hypothetical protein